MKKKTTKDIWDNSYKKRFADYIKKPVTLGPHASQAHDDDPKHNLFTLSRYKFCAKMLVGKKHLLELGCGDGFGLDIVLQEVQPESIDCVDFDDVVILDNKRRFSGHNNLRFTTHDIVKEPLSGQYDAAYSLDVIEHIEPEDEDAFLDNIAGSLDKNSVFIIGTPNATSGIYASKESRDTHINLKDVKSLRKALDKRFYNVFLFSMNDEVVHTGFYPMAHYLLVVATGLK